MDECPISIRGGATLIPMLPLTFVEWFESVLQESVKGPRYLNASKFRVQLMNRLARFHNANNFTLTGTFRLKWTKSLTNFVSWYFTR